MKPVLIAMLAVPAMVAPAQASEPYAVPPIHAQWLKLNGIHAKADEFCRKMTNLPGGGYYYMPGTADYEVCLGIVYNKTGMAMPPRPFRRLQNYPAMLR